MWGLEYPLLFGLPNNKLELVDGLTRCAFPFLERQQAEAHLADWIETLGRWKGVPRPKVRKDGEGWYAEAAGFRLLLAPRPIDLRVPLGSEAFHAFYETYWRRECWPGQPAGLEAGPEWVQCHGDVAQNLWELFGRFRKEYGGQHCGRADIVLNDTAVVAPDQYYFRGSRRECMIEDDYFQGVPELIAEVLSPGSRQFDRGPRKAVYRRAGVPHLWLLDPELETLEVYELTGGDYRAAATYRSGDEFRPALFPRTTVAVEPLFSTQWKRHGLRFAAEEPKPPSDWRVASEVRLGLEHLFLLGHPDRRSEIWGNRTHCVLAFGSVLEARKRLDHFLTEAGRWEQLPPPVPAPVDEDTEQAEVGRFRFTRRGRHVSVDVTVDGQKYRELLRACARREAWDWGEDNL